MVDDNYVRLGSACHCGAPVRLLSGRGRPPKVCEAHTEKPKPERIKKELPKKECLACRGFFTSKDDCTYCSRSCWIAATVKPLCECKWCGDKFKPTRGSLGLFCSYACKGKAHTAKANANKPKTFVQKEQSKCMVCGVDCRGARCSRKCELEHGRNQAKLANESLHRQDAKVNECIECNALYCPLYGYSNTTLCAPCADGRKRAHRSASKVLRKIMQRAAKLETVDPYKVFDRDGWHCRICGVATPKSKRGSYDDDAPELDHIRPLSKRGEHSYRNTQCACRKCNGDKSDEWVSGGFEATLSIG